MGNQENRWALSNWQEVTNWCKERNSQSIICTIDILGENIRTEEDAKQVLNKHIDCIRRIQKENLKASLAVKLSALGANFDQEQCKEYLFIVLKEAQENQVPIEIDIEGTPMVKFTLKTAFLAKEKGYPVILALQSYLDRTKNDLKKVLDHGITVRLVKGAYKGNINDFFLIQKRFRGLFTQLLENESHFLVGTHDRELIAWMKEKAGNNKEIIEFGFLKGLADKTKIILAEQGWGVSEYVPFGSERKAYETRRRRYLSELQRLRRIPAP
ncbi:MAG: proline dehydrogenase family protein [Thermoplasmata archaeon]|nr:MAG: proline dehydrogenase family protein [Thermoplasmata archaeon]